MIEEIRSFFKNDRFSEYVGIQLIEVSKGYAKAKLEIRNEHLNGINIAHGGVLFTLADIAFAAASVSHGTVTVAINMTISIIKAFGKGTLFAEAKEVSSNSKIGSYIVTITNDKKDVVAVFQGMCYRKKEKIHGLQQS